MTAVHEGSWTAGSLAWIEEQRAAHPELDAKALEAHCRANYPYHERQGWAYKAWCKAMRMTFGASRALVTRVPNRGAVRDTDLQPELFKCDPQS